jgi:hypothetical protein
VPPVVGHAFDREVATWTLRPRTHATRLLPLNGTWTTSTWDPGAKAVGCPRPTGGGKKRLLNPTGIDIDADDVFVYPKCAR